MKIEIPNMPRWEQIGGDMDPGAHGGTIARTHGNAIELLKIQPVRSYVGDREAARVGHPFWTREAYFVLRDLDPSDKHVRSALDMIGMSLNTLEEEFTPAERALVIAEALLDYGRADEGPAGWSDDILSEKVKWWGGVGGPEYLADEDEAFRRDVLHEDEDEDEDEDEGEDEDEDEDEGEDED